VWWCTVPPLRKQRQENHEFKVRLARPCLTKTKAKKKMDFREKNISEIEKDIV
jgi:hypothetical protein